MERRFKVGDWVISKELYIIKPFKIEEFHMSNGRYYIHTYCPCYGKWMTCSENKFQLAEDYILKEIWK